MKTAGKHNIALHRGFLHSLWRIARHALNAKLFEKRTVGLWIHGDPEDPSAFRTHGVDHPPHSVKVGHLPLGGDAKPECRLCCTRRTSRAIVRAQKYRSVCGDFGVLEAH